MRFIAIAGLLLIAGCDTGSFQAVADGKDGVWIIGAKTGDVKHCRLVGPDPKCRRE